MSPMQASILDAITVLEAAVTKALDLSRDEEGQAKRWIGRIGIIISLLVLAAAVAPFIVSEAKANVVFGISGLSVPALLALLYSPINKLTKLSRARSAMITLTAAFRVRVLSTSNDRELAKIAKEVFDLLQRAKGG
jgi:Na+/proline symporter